MADNTNPGNFANRPKEEVQNIASKGGQASHAGGFANMDPDKQVGLHPEMYSTVETALIDAHHRRRLRLREDRPQAAPSRKAARRPRRPVARVDLLLEQWHPI